MTESLQASSMQPLDSGNKGVRGPSKNCLNQDVQGPPKKCPNQGVQGPPKNCLNQSVHDLSQSPNLSMINENIKRQVTQGTTYQSSTMFYLQSLNKDLSN